MNRSNLPLPGKVAKRAIVIKRKSARNKAAANRVAAGKAAANKEAVSKADDKLSRELTKRWEVTPAAFFVAPKKF
jgi:hypothetical protein